MSLIIQLKLYYSEICSAWVLLLVALEQAVFL